MKKLLIICLLGLIPMQINAQRTLRLLNAGDAYFRTEQFTYALEAYEKVLRRNRSANVRREVSFRIGQTHQQMLNYSAARNWYINALNEGFEKPEIFLHLSEMSLGLEDFDMAIEYANRFLNLRPDDPFGRKFLESAKFSRENYFNVTLFETQNERQINTTGQEWGVAFFKDNHILFSSTYQPSGGRLDARTGTGYSSIYEVTKNPEADKWGQPAQIRGEVNTIFYEGFMTFHPATQTGYFMNCGGRDGTRETCNIYTSRFDPETNSWKTPEIFPFNSKSFNIGYPSISDDGHVLFFASDMPGGFGGFDLYRMEKDPENGNWGNPVNLGPEINTSLHDSYPFVAGNILYFSSFGLPGFGGFDIFYAEINPDNSLSRPINIGVPINSSADDFGFIINREYTSGFFSSNRPGGIGKDDIYSFTINHNAFDLKGVVKNKTTGYTMSNVDVIVYGNDNRFHRVTTDTQGSFVFPQLDAGTNYMIEVVKDGYVPFSESLTIREKLIASRFLAVPEITKDIYLDTMPLAAATPRQIQQPEQNFPLRPAITGKTAGLPTVYFDLGSYSLTNAAKSQLDSVVNFLRANADAGIVVHAHTDEISGYLFNFYLSQKRAQSVIEYITRMGIPENRLYPFGHGKMNMVIPDATTPEEHRLNRRATFEVFALEEFNQFLAEAPRHSFRYLNSLHKEAHHAVGIEFMVQFAATRSPVNPRFYSRIMNALPHLDIIYYYNVDRFHRYSIGTFPAINQALEISRQLGNMGFDAFVVAFRNGQRISLNEAIQAQSTR
ncbi:MAG TPA: OmpA family protein [Bacteroidales bacterium]|nr:OmpA family protein [Bacteroidales bacterium]